MGQHQEERKGNISCWNGLTGPDSGTRRARIHHRSLAKTRRAPRLRALRATAKPSHSGCASVMEVTFQSQGSPFSSIHKGAHGGGVGDHINLLKVRWWEGVDFCALENWTHAKGMIHPSCWKSDLAGCTFDYIAEVCLSDPCVAVPTNHSHFLAFSSQTTCTYISPGSSYSFQSSAVQTHGHLSCICWKQRRASHLAGQSWGFPRVSQGLWICSKTLKRWT